MFERIPRPRIFGVRNFYRHLRNSKTVSVRFPNDFCAGTHIRVVWIDYLQSPPRVGSKTALGVAKPRPVSCSQVGKDCEEPDSNSSIPWNAASALVNET